MGAVLICLEGRADVADVICAFRDYAEAPKDHFSHFNKLFVLLGNQLRNCGKCDSLFSISMFNL